MLERMTEADWEQLKFMNSKFDDWGDRTKIAKELAYRIDNMRVLCGRSIKLTCPAYATSGHSDKSQHALGNAADIKVLGLTLFDMYELAEKFLFSAIGLYPNNGNPFIHVDVRDLGMDQKRLHWICIDGVYTYDFAPEFYVPLFKRYVRGVVDEV